MQLRLFALTPVELEFSPARSRDKDRPAALVFMPSRSFGISLALCVYMKMDCRQEQAASEMTFASIKDQEGWRSGGGKEEEPGS